VQQDALFYCCYGKETWRCCWDESDIFVKKMLKFRKIPINLKEKLKFGFSAVVTTELKNIKCRFFWWWQPVH
jgi:hypothetical protein